jgi:polar amino acid transport system permease protein
MISVFVEFQQLFLQGFLTTLKLLAAIMLTGIPLGVLVGVMGGRYSKVIFHVVQSLKFFTKIVPVLILLFWLHYPFQALLGVVVDPFWTTVLALGFVNMVGVGFLVQSELGLLPRSYSDAAMTLGMNKYEIIRHIELPILLRRMTPGILLNQASILEYTLLASLISVPELFRVSQTINSMIYDPVSVYTIIVFFFMLILLPLHLLIIFLDKKFKVEYA